MGDVLYKCVYGYGVEDARRGHCDDADFDVFGGGSYDEFEYHDSERDGEDVVGAVECPTRTVKRAVFGILLD